MFQTTKGIVLREAEYRENDRILTILTSELGLISAKARGVKSRSSKLKSGCQLLTYSEFTFLESRGYRTITEANALEQFSRLREDLELLSLGSYMAQTTEVLGQEDRPEPELLSLILHGLYALCRGKDQNLVKAAYELRLAGISGYMPELSACSVCGAEAVASFLADRGVLECADCRGSLGAAVRRPVSPGCLAAMRYVLSCPMDRLFSFALNGRAAEEFCDIAETYFLTQTERGFFTLEFYKSLKQT